MQTKLSPSAQKVQDALDALGGKHTVIEHDKTTRSAKDAADAIGCSVAQIAKSLIFRLKNSGRPLLVITSGANRVDEARLGQLLGEPLAKADAVFVEQATGYAIGGVPPIAHRTELVTLVDEDLLQHAEIWAAAGTPNAVFKVTPDELVKMTGGRVAPVK